MADYKEGTLKAKQRARFITIANDINSIPSIEFSEEIVTMEGTNIISKVPQGTLIEQFADPTVVFPILSPVDGSILGTTSYGEVYTLLYSLYRFLADKRDTAVVEG